MGTEKGTLEAFGTVLKDVVSALRDSVLFLLFLLLLFAPSTIKERLNAAGFTKGSIGGFEWEAQIKSAAAETKTVGQTVDQASDNYDKLIERLSALEKQVTDPAVKATVKDLGDVAEVSRTDLKTADRALKRSLATQQQIVAQISPSSVADVGWIFLGKVTQDTSAWVGGRPQTVGSTSARPAPGTILTVRDDAYLRADGPSAARASAAILGVVKVGDTVEVIDIDYSHAKGGGWFVWAKVRRG
jgi:seryl-tRNA synthetase